MIGEMRRFMELEMAVSQREKQIDRKR